MKRRDLEMHLQDLFEGRLEGDAMARLQSELRTDPEARDAYRDYVHLHNALLFRAEGVDLLRVVPMDRVIERRQRRYLRSAALAAVAVLALGALVMSLILTRTPTPTLTFATSPGTEVSMSHLLAGEDAPAGQVLEPGSRLELRHGTVELEFASGVRGIVRAPADLTLQREELLDLREGTAWFHVPPGAVGFKVSTPDLVLTDLGTEFGIISKPEFPDEVHVFTGKVEVLNRHGLKAREVVAAGQARVTGPAGGWERIPVRRNPFFTELPTTAPVPAVITTEVFNTTQSTYASDVSASDLLHGLTPTTTGWNTRNNASPLELTDGIHGVGFDEVPGDKVQGAWTTVGATAEYHLGRGTNGLGYDITSIQSIADWVNVNFGNQAWTVEVKPVGGSYRSLATVSYQPLSAQPLNGGGTTKVILTDPSGVLASGIEFIKFTADPVTGSVGNAFVWRELDVFGGPTGRPASR